MVKKKKDISPEDIKANIYDLINLCVEIHGINKQDIDKIQEDLIEILPAEEYSRTEDSFSVDEINSYGDRRFITGAKRRRYLENEGVVRYYSKDNTEIITLSRLFISIRLTYEVAHDLKKNIILLNKIVELFNQYDYFEIEKMYIEKRDSIYCKSLYRLYQCFDKKMFGDVGYFLERDKKKIDTGILEVTNKFAYDDCEVEIYKYVSKGYFPDAGEEVYEGKINTIIASDVCEDNVNVEDVLLKLNSISFDIFMYHITDDFARDLVEGKSNKLRKGLNYNG